MKFIEIIKIILKILGMDSCESSACALPAYVCVCATACVASALKLPSQGFGTC